MTTPAEQTVLRTKLSNLVHQIVDIQDQLAPPSAKWGFSQDDHLGAHEFYTKQQKALWVASEVDFTQDRAKFLTLTPTQRNPLLKVLAIFQILDGGVIDTVSLRFLLEAPTLAEKLPYIAQLFGESIHSESYDLQLRSIVPLDDERNTLLISADKEEWIKNYTAFATKYIMGEYPELTRLYAQSLLEGVGFSAFFAVIFWYKFNPYAVDIPGITTSNEMISRDEGLHRDYGVYRSKGFLSKLSGDEMEEQQKVMYSICEELMNIIEIALPTILEEDLPGLTKNDLLTYAKFTADILMFDMGFKPLYKVQNPLAYMRMIGGEQKTNFYDATTTQYTRGDLYTTEGADDF